MSLKFTDDSDTLSFSGPTTGITASYAGQTGEMLMLSRAQIIVLVTYTKGSETSLSMRIELSPNVTRPVTNPATGVDYYVNSTIGTGSIVGEQALVFNTTGKYRIPIPILRQEQILRLSVLRSGGADATAGSIDIKVIDDAQLVTSSLASRQP